MLECCNKCWNVEINDEEEANGTTNAINQDK